MKSVFVEYFVGKDMEWLIVSCCFCVDVGVGFE